MSDTWNVARWLVDPTCRLYFRCGRSYGFTLRVCPPYGVAPSSPLCVSSAGGSRGWKGKRAVMVPLGGKGRACVTKQMEQTTPKPSPPGVGVPFPWAGAFAKAGLLVFPVSLNRHDSLRYLKIVPHLDRLSLHQGGEEPPKLRTQSV